MSRDRRNLLLWRGNAIEPPTEQFAVAAGRDGALVLTERKAEGANAVGADTRVVGFAERAGDVIWVHALGRVWRFERTAATSRTRAGVGPDLSGEIRAPMTGTVRRVDVTPGARVEKGATLLLLEAMKMEHVLRAPIAGAIELLSVRVGDTVDLGAVLARIAPEST